jgi:hypothetical protein
VLSNIGNIDNIGGGGVNQQLQPACLRLTSYAGTMMLDLSYYIYFDQITPEDHQIPL